MLFGLMKFVTWLLSPLALGLAGMAAGGVLAVRRDTRRMALAAYAVAFVWLWVWSSPWFFIFFGGALERQYPPAPVDVLPQADAIIVLGGGINSPTPKTVYAELYAGADRGWHAARCFHAGKAPVVLFSGVGEGPGMKQFLVDLGVPPSKIMLESESKNTYENGLFVREKLKAMGAKRVILVTSAWHLRRAVMTFEKIGVEVIPSGADYEALTAKATQTPAMMQFYLPNPDTLYKNSVIMKEYLGYWAYWLHLHFSGKG
ncbi:MAG: YdcF family protein [Kiritimatiellae bacterium]|nr:YdcF family protein [Kiritimatiellia bacterium]